VTPSGHLPEEVRPLAKKGVHFVTFDSDQAPFGLGSEFRWSRAAEVQLGIR
jgi:hypothetical protein